MPVAKFQMPDGRIGRFEVPEGTTPESAQGLIETHLASQQPDNRAKLAAEMTHYAAPESREILNPEEIALRRDIEKAPKWKRMLMAGGAGLVKTALGAKQLVSDLTPDQQGAIEAASAFQEAEPVPALLGDVGAMTVPGLGLARYAKAIPQVAKFGRSLAIPETGLQAAGSGAAYLGVQPNVGAQADFTERLKQAAIGGSAGMIGQKMLSGAGRLLSPKSTRTIPTGLAPENVVYPEGVNALSELARVKTLKELPVSIGEEDIIRSQITRSYPQQEAERLVAGQPIIGSELSSRLARGQEKMIANLDELAKQTGATTPTKEEAGETVRTWMQNIYGAAKKDTTNAYNYAKQLHGDKQFHPSSDVVESLVSNRAMPGYKELFSQAQNMGIIVPKSGGGFKSGRVTVNDLDKFKVMANQVANSSDGTTRYAGGDIVNKIYKQMDDIAPEFRDAANMRKRQGMVFEGPKVTQKILGTSKGRFGGTEQELGGVTIPDYKVASEKLIDSIVSGSVEDLRYVRNLLVKGTNQQRELGMSSIKEMRGSVLDGARNIWDSTVTPNAKANQLNKYFDKFGDEKMKILFGKAGYKNISEFRKAANIMNKLESSPEGGSQTAGRLIMMGSSLMNTLGRIPIAGAGIAKAAGIAKDVGTASSAKKIPKGRVPLLLRRSDNVRKIGNKLSEMSKFGAAPAVGMAQGFNQ